MGGRLQAGIPSRYVPSQLGQLSLSCIRGHYFEYQLWLLFYASYRSGEASYKLLFSMPAYISEGCVVSHLQGYLVTPLKSLWADLTLSK